MSRRGRRRSALGAAAAAASALAVATAATAQDGPRPLRTAALASERLHRLQVPPAPLARSLTVDESEFRIRVSKTAVGAGRVTIRAYNRGEDDHDLVVLSGGRALAHAALKPGASAVLVPLLPPGPVRLICSLQAGTPQSHEALGMRVQITAR